MAATSYPLSADFIIVGEGLPAFLLLLIYPRDALARYSGT
jgi:hypothetical protein